MALELIRIGDVFRRANKKRVNDSELKSLKEELVEKEKAAEAALEEADKATTAAEEARLKLAEVVAADEENSETENLADETSAQKIARLEKELADAIIIRELEEKLAAEKAATNTTTTKETTPAAAAQVKAEKLNVTSAPKVEATTEVYEPETPKAGVKGAAARRK